MTGYRRRFGGKAPKRDAKDSVFFAIRRASGLIDIFNAMKTFKGKTCVSRNVQSKLGIPADRIGFAFGIEKATDLKLRWHELDLSDVVEGHAEQVTRIKA